MRSSSSSSFDSTTLIKLGFLLIHVSLSHAQLSTSFYDKTCPQVFDIATNTIVNALRSDPRIAASILRLHFHDCFVNVRYNIIFNILTYTIRLNNYFQLKKNILAYTSVPLMDLVSSILFINIQ